MIIQIIVILLSIFCAEYNREGEHEINKTITYLCESLDCENQEFSTRRSFVRLAHESKKKEIIIIIIIIIMMMIIIIIITIIITMKKF